MKGDGRVRFCSHCQLNVYNLSELSADEARALFKQHEGQRLCVRLYQRRDGTVLTRDCPTGLSLLRYRRQTGFIGKVLTAIAVALVGIVALSFTFRRAFATRTTGVRVAPELRR